MPSELVPLPGSDRDAPPGTRVGDADPRERLLVSIVVRRVPAPPVDADLPEEPAERRAAHVAAFGADPADLDAVAAFARDAGLTVESADAARRTVIVSGTAARMSAAFGVTLGTFRHDGATFRGREGVLHVPAALADVVEAVLGLDNRPQAHSRLRRGPTIPENELPAADAEAGGGRRTLAAAAPVPTPLWATQVAQLYDFPTGVTGAGQTIALIELGGGYRDSELARYFAKAKTSAPTVLSEPVDQGANKPGADPGADGEVMLDIEVAGSAAPGATIVVYFADNSDRGFLDAVTTAVHDQVHHPSVISISWGGAESTWTRQSLTAFDGAFADAARLGITVLAAAGDHGAGDGVTSDALVHADFPASSPRVVACGGTVLVAGGGAIVSEKVWNSGDGWATGGGISDVFDVPDYQQTVKLPTSLNADKRVGRGLPDVAGNADNASGYLILVDGQWAPIGGTSAVAPLYAGLVALLNEGLGSPVGELNTALYAVPDTAQGTVFGDVTAPGDNSTPRTKDTGPSRKGYHAADGWDPCTGLGSVRGTALLEHLRQAL
ncbi:MAG TPA: S53 family peptidase [Pseudonocardia sp.]